MKLAEQAFDEAERIHRRVQKIVEAYDEEVVLDRPTLETVGALAEYLDNLGISVRQLTDAHRTTSSLLQNVITMRGEIVHQEKLAREEVAS